MNNLARNIGIWYYDREWAEKLFEEILNGCPRCSLFRIYRNKLEIKLTDGTLIRFLNASCTNRAVALTESYIQDGISYDIYLSLIVPVTKRGTMGKYIIKNYNDIREPKDATLYYLEKSKENTWN